MADKVIIDMKHIVKRYFIGQPNELEVLHGIDLQVHEGEFVAIVGQSGSGKSTLMNMIGALDRPTEGEYSLNGVDMFRADDRDLSAIRCNEIGLFFRLTISWQGPRHSRTSNSRCFMRVPQEVHAKNAPSNYSG